MINMRLLRQYTGHAEYGLYIILKVIVPVLCRKKRGGGGGSICMLNLYDDQYD